MEKIVGKYKHYKNENIEDYFAAVGVPYLARKMMSVSSPTMEISWNDETKKMTIRNTSTMRTTEQVFSLNEEYDEKMPDAVIKSKATIELDGSLKITSVIPETGETTERHYTFTDDECIVTLNHQKVATSGKRYYKRIN